MKKDNRSETVQEFISTSAEETKNIGIFLAPSLAPSDIITLHGELGAGKTTFVKGIIEGRLGIDPKEVSSPTFTYVHSFFGRQQSVFHFDLYRMKNEVDFCELGFEEYFEQGICCIEWAEKIKKILPSRTIHIKFIYGKEEGHRIIRIHARYYA